MAITPAGVQRGPLPFAESFFARLPYASLYVISAGGASRSCVCPIQWRLNGASAPLVGGGGHIPEQWSMLATLYQQYKVFGCRVKVTFSDPISESFFVGCRVRASTDPLATVSLNPSQLAMLPNTQTGYLVNTGEQARVFEFYVRIEDIFGVPKSQYADVSYAALTTALPPAGDVWLEPFVSYITPVTDPIPFQPALNCMVELNYYIMFSSLMNQVPTP